MEKKVYEFKSGKENWLETEVGIEGDQIVIRNELGWVSVDPESVSDLIKGLEQAKQEKDREMG